MKLKSLRGTMNSQEFATKFTSWSIAIGIVFMGIMAIYAFGRVITYEGWAKNCYDIYPCPGFFKLLFTGLMATFVITFFIALIVFLVYLMILLVDFIEEKILKEKK